MIVTMVVASFLVFGLMGFSPGNVASKTLGPYASYESKDILWGRLANTGMLAGIAFAIIRTATYGRA